jgi:hypothetical protein
MRRPAFWSAPVVIFMLLASVTSAFVLERARSKFLISLPVAVDINYAEAACLGLGYAEDWLLESAASGQFPMAADPGAANILKQIEVVSDDAANILKRTEAVRDDGSAILQSAGELTSSVSLYVADLNYTSGLFTGDDELANCAYTPFIPRMPALDDDFSYVRFYFLRASVRASVPASVRASVRAEKNAFFVSEEILSVTKDKATLNISARRILSRSGLMLQ